LKYRSKTAIHLEILGALLEQPRLRTSLAQIVNVNLARLDEEYLNPLLRANLVKKDHIESHDVLAITVEGRKFWEDLYTLQRKLDPDLTMPPNRLWG
jgi:predicted transcriptional regulator